MTYITVDINLDQISDEDIIEEAEARGLKFDTSDYSNDYMLELLQKVWQKRRENKPYDSLIEEMIRHGLGKVL